MVDSKLNILLIGTITQMMALYSMKNRSSIRIMATYPNSGQGLKDLGRSKIVAKYLNTSQLTQ